MARRQRRCSVRRAAAAMVLFAWARQAPGMLRDPPEGGFDWHLDPTERAGAILPMLSWLAADLVMVDGRPTWLVQGMAVIGQFPLATRAKWASGHAAGVGPAVLCTIDVANGTTRFYVDPAADSLGIAWARLAGALVAPAATIPLSVRSGVTYAREWFAAQPPCCKGRRGMPGGCRTGRRGAACAGAIWVTARIPGRQVVWTNPAAAES